MSICSNPAAASLSRYSVWSSAPAMQPTHSRMLSRTFGLMSPRVTTSETAKRPPGFSTRNASCSTRPLSAERLMTQLEMMTSTELSGSGMFSISPFRNSTFSIPRLALVLVSQSQHVVRHVEAVCSTSKADALCGGQHINPTTGAKVKHSLAFFELSQHRGVTTTQGRTGRFFRYLAGLSSVVQVPRDGIATSFDRSRRTATGTPAAVDAQSGLPVLLSHDFLDAFGAPHNLLFAKGHNSFWFYRLITCAAFGVKELQQFL